MLLQDRIKKLELTPRKKLFTQFIGDFGSNFKGKGIDFTDIREYVPGDSVKDIYWKVLARTNKLFVKEYIENRELQVTFAMDASASMRHLYQILPESKHQIFLTAYLLVQACVNHNDAFNTFIFRADQHRLLKYGKGKVQMHKVLNEIETAFSDLSLYEPVPAVDQVRTLLRKLKNQALVLWFTDHLDDSDPEFEKLLSACGSKHDLIIVYLDTVPLYQEHEGGTIYDVESGQAFGLSRESAQHAVEQNEQYLAEWRRRCMKKNISLLRLDHRSDAIKEVVSLFRQRAIQKCRR